ncbi:hypothetical protein EDM56_24025 [Brevibacillus fluminis]|uniref:Transcriptional regulator YeiL n=1 Tax=Brevibacillus fluminis TaxID=511487 RepID=A0A3M8D3D1_9BACL|nr:cyclic nucleotide-binding domain-containing protein [Brevibacillus fluminis]RNB82388.1 hypothetical protein EDM56_24025 [Brevibacillus fluminis]
MQKVLDTGKIRHAIGTYGLDQILTAETMAHIELFRFDRHEHLCKAEEQLDYLLFLIEGKAKVYMPQKNGKALLLQFYNPLKVIGDIEFMTMDHANSNIQAIEETYCLAVPMEVIRKCQLDDPAFLRYMCASLGDKLFRLSKYSSQNLLYPLENRVASYILAHEKSGCAGSMHSMTEVAELLGTSYRHLLRTFTNLCKQGAIVKMRDRFEILDIGLLEELARDLYE